MCWTRANTGPTELRQIGPTIGVSGGQFGTHQVMMMIMVAVMMIMIVLMMMIMVVVMMMMVKMIMMTTSGLPAVCD